jgi:hypothetical protein
VYYIHGIGPRQRNVKKNDRWMAILQRRERRFCGVKRFGLDTELFESSLGDAANG